MLIRKDMFKRRGKFLNLDRILNWTIVFIHILINLGDISLYEIVAQMFNNYNVMNVLF